ncbi:HET-domain-containing protein [Pyrenophora teres f. maculata]|nr:HET-domain-containing protein [Pyrenophora teres f. maculata]
MSAIRGPQTKDETVQITRTLHNIVELRGSLWQSEFYTPIDAGEEHAVPWLGLRDSERDEYRELTDDLPSRLKEAHMWYQNCKTQHPLCVSSKVEWPRRVLDIAADSILLVDSTSILSSPDHQQGGYACLSYVWGTDGNLTTLKRNLRSHMDGIDMATFPRTLADAIHITRSLDLRYLWIDALCIIQDDWEDQMYEIPRMSSIYHSAEFVISAQSAANVHEGFLDSGRGANALFKRAEMPFRMPDGTYRKVKLSIRKKEYAYLEVPAHHSVRFVRDSDVIPLTNRAWAQQESFLAFGVNADLGRVKSHPADTGSPIHAVP